MFSYKWELRQQAVVSQQHLRAVAMCAMMIYPCIRKPLTIYGSFDFKHTRHAPSSDPSATNERLATVHEEDVNATPPPTTAASGSAEPSDLEDQIYEEMVAKIREIRPDIAETIVVNLRPLGPASMRDFTKDSRLLHEYTCNCLNLFVE